MMVADPRNTCGITRLSGTGVGMGVASLLGVVGFAIVMDGDLERAIISALPEM